LIEKSLFDSALFTIRQAFGNGLSDDSLFYAWAEIYCSKGALDTAIALSLAVKARHDHPLYYAVLKQRYLLYTLTNQKDRADAMFDSLNTIPAYHLKKLIPEVQLFLRAGVQQNSTKEAEILPSYLDYAYPENEPVRGAGAGGLNLKWKFPLRKSRGFEFTAGTNLYQYNPPSSFKLKNALDSSYSIEHAQIRYYILSGMLSGGYKISGLYDYSEELSIKHEADLSILTFIKELFIYGMAGYSYDVSRALHTWSGSLFGSREWSKRRSNSMSISVNGVHMKNDTLLDYGIYRKMYVDGMTFYNDSTYSKSAIWWESTNSESSKRALDTVFVSMILPRSYITAKAILAQNFSFKYDFNIGCSFVGAVSWFVDKYKWADNLVDASGKPTYIFDRSDSSWYWASLLNPLRKVTSGEPLKLNHQKKRVDQTVSANVNFRKSFKNIVTIGLDGSLSRTFSNLEDYTLVDIPVWSYSVMLSTTFSFNPAGKLR
jgi:hypothetical protein